MRNEIEEKETEISAKRQKINETKSSIDRERLAKEAANRQLAHALENYDQIRKSQENKLREIDEKIREMEEKLKIAIEEKRNIDDEIRLTKAEAMAVHEKVLYVEI